MTSAQPSRRRRSHAPALRRLALGLVLVLVVACGGGAEDPAFGTPDDLNDREIAELCELLASAELPEGMTRETYDELVARFAVLCAQIGVPLPLAGGSSPGGPTAGGVTPNGDADGDGAADHRADGARSDSHLIGQDPVDDDVRRRAIAAGPQCDLASVDLSMSEVMKAPAIGPMGSPPFDAALATKQYRAPAQCLPEPYRSEWLVIAAAYEPLFELLEAYAAASNQGFESLVELGEQLADIEARLAALESDEVQSAIAATEMFFDELRATGAWDEHGAASPWGRWWDSDEFRELWSDSQWAAARGGAQLPDLPNVP